MKSRNRKPNGNTVTSHPDVLPSHLGLFSGAFFPAGTSGLILQLVHRHLIGKETTGSRKWVRIFSAALAKTKVPKTENGMPI